ncbi:MAG: acetate--CoA ligase family protein [Candidatus Moraniibacteriota bacterium]
MNNETLGILFAPKSIAIVGASNKKNKIGTILVNNIIGLGYKGKVFFVNPSYGMLGLRKCYSSLEKIPKEVDLAILAIPSKFVLETIEKSADKIKNFVIISAGFSETGANGKKLEDKINKLAQAKGLNILGPNCLGFIAPTVKLNASFADGMPENGNIAFVSQSGALAVALMDKAKNERLAFSKIISVGNKMQISESELIEYLGNDDRTKVIGIYLEGIKDGAKFLKAVGKVSLKKPIVILKAGKTAKTQLAIASHTGALAGSDEITSVAFEKTGIIRANDLDEFLNLLKLISNYPSPKSSLCGVVTNAGGAGVLATDAFKDKNLSLADIPDKAKKKLKKILPAESSVENPIDLLGDAQDDRYRAVLEILRNEKIENIFCLLTPQGQTKVGQIALVATEYSQKKDLNIIPVFIGGEKISQALSSFVKNGLVNFATPEAAIGALEKYRVWQQFTDSRTKVSALKIDHKRKDKAQLIISKAIAEKRKALSFSDSAEMMKLYGIEAVAHADVTQENIENLNLGFPLALKIDSDTVLHKTDQGGLILGIKSIEQLKQSFSQMQEKFPGEKIIAQAQVDKFAEIILGIKRDAIFGPVIVYGLGGIYTEVFKLVNFLLVPMNLREIEMQIMKSKISFLFKGVRGQAACDSKQFAKILLGLMYFAQENLQVKEFDINPLFIHNYKQDACAVDIKIIF